MFFERLAHIILTSLAVATAAGAQSAADLDAQMEGYQAVHPKNILELQPFRHEMTAPLGAGGEVGLISINPNINSWFVLRVQPEGAKGPVFYHLENPAPRARAITLGAGPDLRISDDAGERSCAPWQGAPSALEQARNTGLPFAPVCDGALYLRNKVSGSRTNVERTAEFLRDHVWGGESIVRFVRDSFFKDRQFESSTALEGDGAGRLDVGPGAAIVDRPLADRPVLNTLMDVALEGTGSRNARMAVGLWYPVAELPGVYASAIQPRWIGQSVMNGPGSVKWMDGTEMRADVYLIAFDMSRFDLGFAMGTDHPRLNWSPRPPASVRPRGMPGPDGVSKPDPLVTLGMVSPALADRTVATFTGGFKREHGAFKWGDYITLNFGTHYGFVEHGAVFSKLWPHLSTIYVLDDGTWGMKTWTEADAALLPRIRFARQNGVPILERDPVTGQGLPGPLVPHWGAGNWSGSADAKLRTLRAGACVKQVGDTPWLIYGYFSSATPSGMARTFQAYGCDYAMLMDMNALEHTYLALYVRHAGQVHVQHMVPGMALVDKKSRDGTAIPRFLGFVDNRDLFYLTEKEAGR